MKRFFTHPLTRDLDLDDPEVTLLRREIVLSKSFLKKVYEEWYSLIVSRLPADSPRVLEIGSGPGFMRQIYPSLITSEVFPLAGIDRIEDATALSYGDSSLDAIVMTDVFHHIPNAESFLREASRCLRPGGRVIMIEPWRTTWSQWVYRRFHHEPFIPEATTWELPRGGPLSNANGALPWIVFLRDREKCFGAKSKLCVNEIRPIMPVSYIASGGFMTWMQTPHGLFKAIRWIESHLARERGAMFALIVVDKTE